MINFRFVVVIFIAQFQLIAVAQDYNGFDTDSLRHGSWQKNYSGTDQIRYEGTFDHGKEVGTFKFYDRFGGHPTATKKYSHDTDSIEVTYYTTAGKKVSVGMMENRKRVGLWKSYHQDGKTVMIEEFYIDGLLDGERKVFFISASVAQKEIYKKGKREGVATYYTDDGKVLKMLTYKNDELHGPSQMYNGFGIIEVEGSYENNRKHGIWTYYKEGKPDKKIKYPQNKIGVQ